MKKKEKNQNIQTLRKSVLLAVGLSIAISTGYPESVRGDNVTGENWNAPDVQSNYINIRNPKGKLYAYIVLLFNENPHFVNIIQEYTIPMELMQKEGFHITEYKNYLNKVKDPALYRLASVMLNVYLNPGKFDEISLQQIRDGLEKKNIIVRFSRDKNHGRERVILDYCIYGSRRKLSTSHPLFGTKEIIYNIIPYLYYDEFSTSNSTFYFDMIYINPEEVQNDYIIARRVMNGENVETMFFVGARVTEDIKFCLKRAFTSPQSIKAEIWKMFEIHELTHKILNNSFNYFDQVTGEELALCSTIYHNVYLGLSVMYSYLDYNVTNPHRIAALNYLKFVANESGKKDTVKNPALVRNMLPGELRRIPKNHFNTVLRSMQSGIGGVKCQAGRDFLFSFYESIFPVPRYTRLYPVHPAVE